MKTKLIGTLSGKECGYNEEDLWEVLNGIGIYKDDSRFWTYIFQGKPTKEDLDAADKNSLEEGFPIR